MLDADWEAIRGRPLIILGGCGENHKKIDSEVGGNRRSPKKKIEKKEAHQERKLQPEALR